MPTIDGSAQVADRRRRTVLRALAALLVSAAPLAVLIVLAVLHRGGVALLLHESELFPGFSRALLVAVPLAGLGFIKLRVFAATRSLRATILAAIATSLLALTLALGAVDIVNSLTSMGGPD